MGRDEKTPSGILWRSRSFAPQQAHLFRYNNSIYWRRQQRGGFNIHYISPNRFVALGTLIGYLGFIALGVGGTSTFLILYRHQRTTKPRIALDLRGQEDTGLDVIEQHAIALCGKAVDHLGSNQATLRSAGLRSLERIGDRYPAFRQTVADIICDYLRIGSNFLWKRKATI